jgi:Leucine-rich repeat (LRR) protein
MKQPNLWILAIFPILCSSVIGDNNLICTFQQVGTSYACALFGQQISNKNATVQLSGIHNIDGMNDINVTMIIAFETKILYIPNNLFTKFPNINRFHCDDCYLTEIKNWNLKGAENLKDLSLKSGSIRTVEDDVFRHCKKLGKLSLKANRISTIERKAFRALENLKELDLSHNYIFQLPDGIFDDLVSLETLLMGGNTIQALHNHLFQYNSNIRQLIFENNFIQLIEPNLIDHLSNLTLISLGGNFCVGSLIKGNLNGILPLFKEATKNCDMIEFSFGIVKAKIPK